MSLPDTSSDPWAAHRRAQLSAWQSATPVQRLAWLEEALVLAAELRRVRPSIRPAADRPPPADDQGDVE